MESRRVFRAELYRTDSRDDLRTVYKLSGNASDAFRHRRKPEQCNELAMVFRILRGNTCRYGHINFGLSDSCNDLLHPWRGRLRYTRILCVFHSKRRGQYPTDARVSRQPNSEQKRSMPGLFAELYRFCYGNR